MLFGNIPVKKILSAPVLGVPQQHQLLAPLPGPEEVIMWTGKQSSLKSFCKTGYCPGLEASSLEVLVLIMTWCRHRGFWLTGKQRTSYSLARENGTIAHLYLDLSAGPKRGLDTNESSHYYVTFVWLLSWGLWCHLCFSHLWSTTPQSGSPSGKWRRLHRTEQGHLLERKDHGEVLQSRNSITLTFVLSSDPTSLSSASFQEGTRPASTFRHLVTV